MTMPEPMPVPTATQIMLLAPRAAPKPYSPSAARLTSFSITTGRPKRASSRCASGKSSQPRAGAATTLPSSVMPGTPTPIPATVTCCACARFSSPSISVASRSRAASSCLPAVGSVSSASATPSTVFSMPKIFVPPMSTLIAARALRSFTPLCLACQFAPNELRAFNHRLELAACCPTSSLAEAAVGCYGQFFGRDDFEHFANALGDVLRLFDVVILDVDQPGCQLLLTGKLAPEIVFRHFAVGELQRELVGIHVEDMRE